MKTDLIKLYQDKIDNISAKEFNQDQKKLCKELLSKVEHDKLEAVYQFLAQRLKKGFVFDAAPELDSDMSAILVKNKELSFSFSNDEKPNRLIIGENYDALKNLVVLQKQNGNRSQELLYDIIYIDPPYNTEATAADGNGVANDKEDKKTSKFIYRDKFSSQGWANLMNERLKMVRQLLKEDGFIAMSIDDTEQATLKLIADEIFGVENFVTSLIWQKKNTTSGSDKSNIDSVTEFIHIYAKNKQNTTFNSMPINQELYTLEDKHVATRGKYYLSELDRACSRNSFQYISSLDYKILAPDGTWFDNYNNIKKKQSHRYTIGQNLFKWMNENDFIVVLQKTDKNGIKYWKAYRKSYCNVTVNRSKPYEIIKRAKGRNWNNLIINNTMTTARGSSLLKSILNHKDFPFPKPLELIKFIINLHPNKNAKILDFFAGSGTTGHAVIDLNREDEGKRSYTLITNNQNNIGYEVTYKRLFIINHGYSNSGEQVEWSKKNKPYCTNLNVYDICYCSNKLIDNDANIEAFINSWQKLLNDFNITNDNASERRAIVKALAALTPQKKEIE